MNIFAPLGGQAARNTTGLPGYLGAPGGLVSPGRSDIASSGPGYGVAPAPAAAGGAAAPNLTGIAPYTSAILNDPIYKALQAQVTAANQAAQGTAQTGFGQALSTYGTIPDLQATAQHLGLDPSSPLYQMLMQAANNPATQNAANQLNASGLSTTAQENTANQQALAKFLGGQNNANGGYQSGATGVGVGEQEQANSLAQYQNSQALLSQLAGLAASYNTAYQTGQGQLSQGLQDAATREIGLGSPTAKSVTAQVVPSLNIGG